MPRATTAGFQTYQTPSNYEGALARHSQYVRWTKSTLCPCLDTISNQADPKCTLCKGRGRVFSNPGEMRILNEVIKHNGSGVFYPEYTPIKVGSASILRKNVSIPLSGTQPLDGNTILSDYPYYKAWEQLTASYDYVPIINVVNENSTVVFDKCLKTLATDFNYKGKIYPGSISSVSRVYNVTRDQSLSVVGFSKDYIYVRDMLNWQSGDILEVDYEYQRPFSFLVVGITPKIRYSSPWVMDQADALLMTPYWAKVSSNDLITVLTAEYQGQEIIEPRSSGNDVIRGCFDLTRITEILLLNGSRVNLSNVIPVERNQIKWLSPKPTTRYTVRYTYSPTFVALEEGPMIRTSENKEFVNRINLKKYDAVNKVKF